MTYPDDKGLNDGTMAPNIKTEDIYGVDINLDKISEDNQGVILDFFRGAW